MASSPMTPDKLEEMTFYERLVYKTYGCTVQEYRKKQELTYKEVQAIYKIPDK